MQYIWMGVDVKGNVKSTTSISLEQNGQVYWDRHEAAKGQWKYFYQGDSTSFMTIEFSASCKGPWKRHIMLQVSEDKFRLLDKHDRLYNSDSNLWTQNSVAHNNNNVVAMIRVNGKEFVDG